MGVKRLQTSTCPPIEQKHTRLLVFFGGAEVICSGAPQSRLCIVAVVTWKYPVARQQLHRFLTLCFNLVPVAGSFENKSEDMQMKHDTPVVLLSYTNSISLFTATRITQWGFSGMKIDDISTRVKFYRIRVLKNVNLLPSCFHSFKGDFNWLSWIKVKSIICNFCHFSAIKGRIRSFLFFMYLNIICMPL